MKDPRTVRKIGRGQAVSVLLAGMVALLLPACSLKRTAVNVLGNALAGGGGVYTSDDDPELIREALPFLLVLLVVVLLITYFPALMIGAVGVMDPKG
jgi:hypothetical protein